MKRQRKERTIHTFDLGPEQLQIIEEPGEQARVLFRGIWLREGANPRVEHRLKQVPGRGADTVDSR